MPPLSWNMLSDSESSSHDDESQTHDNDVNQHHSPFHFISSQIQEIITQISDDLHKVQQRKGQQLIIGYNYKMDCDISPNNDNNINSNNISVSDSSPAWNIVTTPKTSSVDRVLENWKYQGQDLQDDGLFLSYIDLTLETFEDLERVTDLLVEIGAKYVDNIRENLKTAVGFDILFNNMGKIRAALEELCVTTTDAVDNIGEDNDVKENMDQLMVCYRNVCEKLPVSLKMEGKCDVAGRGVSLDILDDDEEEVKDVLDIGDYKNLKLEETKNYHSRDVRDLKSYSIDGIGYVASCSYDKTVNIFGLEDRSVVAMLKGHTDWVQSLELYKTRDGTQCLASCSYDGLIKLWNLHSNALITTLQNSSRCSAYSLAHFVKDDKPYLACGYYSGDIVVWDLESHKIVATLKGHSGSVHALDLMGKNNKQYLVSAGDDGKIRVWDLETYELVKAINNAHDNAIWSLSTFVYDGKLCIASGDGKGRIKIWDAENYSLVSTLEGHTRCVNEIKLCQSGGITMLASAGSDKCIKFWRLDDMSLSHILTSTHSFKSLEFVKDVDEKMMIISGCSNGNLSFWKEQENRNLV